jgi:hypothetical protein
VPAVHDADRPELHVPPKSDDRIEEAQPQLEEEVVIRQGGRQAAGRRSPEVLLVQARQEDAAHRAAHQKPISADTLRVRLGVGAAQARRLVKIKIVRSEFQSQTESDSEPSDVPREVQRAEAAAA